jgi:NTP pyrophosphatase (non-canonical NTP hydrolase)
MKKAIKVSGGTRVEVSPINTLNDLAEVAAKFAEIKQTDGAESVCDLAICVGDLSYSVMSGEDTAEQYAEEVADVLIATMVIAANRGITGDQISEAIRSRIAAQTGDVVANAITGMMSSRGMKPLTV